MFGQGQSSQDHVSQQSLATARFGNHSTPDNSGRFDGLTRSSNNSQWSYQNQTSPHPDQTPLSIPQTLYLGQAESLQSPYGPNGQLEPTYRLPPMMMPYPTYQQQPQLQRIGRPISTQMGISGTPMVAPQPAQQRMHHQHQQQQYQHHQHQHHQQLQPTYQVPTTPQFGGNFAHNHVPMSRSESDGSQASVLKIPTGYFPIYNGTDWILISHNTAVAAGIPLPDPQNSPIHGTFGEQNSHRASAAPTPRLDDLPISHTESPLPNMTPSRQGSDLGRPLARGVPLSRTGSESQRGSVPPPTASSRASSPADYRIANKSPSSGSPSYHGVQHEPSKTMLNLELMELLQNYDKLNHSPGQGKSVTTSEAGSPVDGTTTPKKQESFERSSALKDITEWIEKHKDYLLREQPELLVPGQIDFGNINPKAKAVHKTIRIENHGSRIVQLQARSIIPNAYDQLTCHSQESIYTHPANGTEPMFGNIEISLATGSNLGFFSSWLLILVNESSMIGRKITWNVTNNTQLEREMDPYAKSFTPAFYRSLNLRNAHTVVSGDSVDTIDFQEYLKAADHPCYKKHNGKFSLEPPVVESLEVILPGKITIDLSADSYASRLLPLLQVEQHLIEEDVSSYNLYMVEIKIYDAALHYFQIQVSGLSERCPLLLRGDAIIVRQVTNGRFSGVEYRTFVHGTNMRSNCVYVHLPIGALPTLVNERWNIQFKVSNNKVREMYRAVSGVQEFIGYHPRNPSGDGDGDQYYSPRSFLFPTIHDAKPKVKLPNLTLQFMDPSLNWEQKAAVQSIIRNDYGLVPFIISGPPGTGKTKTLVETAFQILRNDGQSNILITAPSHSACDTIMLRLIGHLESKFLFRLNGPTRTFAEVPTPIMPYCYGTAYFGMPPLNDLLQFRIVVCTCADAGLLISSGASNLSLREYMARQGTDEEDLKRSHWTHLLIDEAVQAIEPETDIPLLCVLDEAEIPPQIVLCGDHQQLGPKTFLPELQLSFLERLITTEPLYRDHPQSRQFARPKGASNTRAKKLKDTEYLEKTIPCFANLVQNYRCHPKMLMMPSALFYNDTLVASADKAKINSMLGSSVLPNPECPIAFVGVNGMDASNIEEAISWYNAEEAEKVASIIESLLENSNDNDGFHVEVAEIGVIAPFREQVKLLRQVLRSRGLAGVNVGTVEDYQGQEYRIMFISTTRSRAKYLDQDVRQGLGLVHFRKRFNVALTRAMAMLVIVGNPELLVRDEHWADYIHFCLRNGAYTGCPLPDSIINAHATGQKQGMIGRLEMNSFVSQFVENLDRSRWLGGNVEEEQEGFIVVPSGSDSELDDEDQVGEDEDVEPGDRESENDYEENQEYNQSLEGLSHALSQELDLNNKMAQQGGHRFGGQNMIRIKDIIPENSDRGEEEDDETRVARERLAIGSLNIDEDTPELQKLALNHTNILPLNRDGTSGGRFPADHRTFGHQLSHSTMSSMGGNADTVFRNQQLPDFLSHQQQQQQQQQRQYQQYQHLQQQQQQLQQHQQQQKNQPHQLPMQSPVTWPSNDREFKRMSNSKLVLERSFDPTEQDIFEDY
ncbi:hypothetical protein BGX27_011063 [Mortierella sp. AM989]|nr:hypothetical protein BGX27_011063 [Mortierella sp. AM989]